MSDAVVLTCSDGVATIRLHRPESGNAIDLDLARALRASARACAADREVRCVLLRGTGKMFCAGGDIRLIAASADPSALLDELAGTLHEAVVALAEMAKPLVVLVNGPAAGAGFSLAMLGDIVIAAGSAHFTAAYTAVGLTPDGGLTWLLPRLIGLRKAQELIFTNRRVTAAAAETLGLVTRVVGDDELHREGAKIAAALAAGPTDALGKIRGLLADATRSSLSDQLRAELTAISAAAGGRDGREGVAAFLDKRAPGFQG